MKNFITALLFSIFIVLIAIGSMNQGCKSGYDKGFQAGIKYGELRRKQAHDSIVVNCKWNNGVPVKIRNGYKELE